MKLASIRQTVASVLSRQPTGSENTRTQQSDDDTGTLLHTCPGCGEVYLSERPHRCSTCDRMTTPSTED